MKANILLFFLLYCCTLPLHAQEHCGSMQAHQALSNTSPDYARQTALNDEQWATHQQQLKAGRIVVSGKDTIYEVPVVFHIIHAGEPLGSWHNAADSVIDSALVFLNKSLAATWPGYPDTATGGVNVPIRFVLARRDPDCKPTNGITRTDGRFIPAYPGLGLSIGPHEEKLKKVTAWPNTNYYNIWVLRIDGAKGFAYFSPSAGIRDGTMVDPSGIYPDTVTHTYKQLLPHELGHGFSLYHTFQGRSCVDTNCLIDGDQICDTEPHTVLGCVSGTNACTGLPWGNVRYNYMNYSDSCADRFTGMQKKRIMFSMLGERISLLYSSGLTPPGAPLTLLPPACTPPEPTSKDKNIGPHNVFLENLRSFSYGFLTEGQKGYLDKTCFFEPAQLRQGKTYNLKVSSGLEYQYNRAWIDYNNDGAFTAPEEILQAHVSFGKYGIQTDTFTIPRKGVVCGKPLRMRVISDVLSGKDTLSPCRTLVAGQVEDFAVFIEADSVTPAGIISPTESTISIYPNPATEVLHIENAADAVLSVYSLEGKLLLQVQHTATINIGQLSEGLYLLRITDRQTGQTLKHYKFLKRED